MSRRDRLHHMLNNNLIRSIRRQEREGDHGNPHTSHVNKEPGSRAVKHERSGVAREPVRPSCVGGPAACRGS